MCYEFQTIIIYVYKIDFVLQQFISASVYLLTRVREYISEEGMQKQILFIGKWQVIMFN